MQMKVDRELEEAISKHGEVQVPEEFEDQLKAKIENTKKKIAAMWLEYLKNLLRKNERTNAWSLLHNLCSPPISTISI